MFMSLGVAVWVMNDARPRDSGSWQGPPQQHGGQQHQQHGSGQHGKPMRAQQATGGGRLAGSMKAQVSWPMICRGGAFMKLLPSLCFFAGGLPASAHLTLAATVFAWGSILAMPLNSFRFAQPTAKIFGCAAHCRNSLTTTRPRSSVRPWTLARKPVWKPLVKHGRTTSASRLLPSFRLTVVLVAEATASPASSPCTTSTPCCLRTPSAFCWIFSEEPDSTAPRETSTTRQSLGATSFTSHTISTPTGPLPTTTTVLAALMALPYACTSRERSCHDWPRAGLMMGIEKPTASTRTSKGTLLPLLRTTSSGLSCVTTPNS
mmetsp:Transcript_16794/g.23135  ORF Transcript_16794/g.23135 Transcript_16794/m.23135 type:complete len:319 (-) Transcript_16794:289-1245(-)